MATATDCQGARPLSLMVRKNPVIFNCMNSEFDYKREYNGMHVFMFRN